MRMRIIFCLLLMLPVGHNQKLEAETVGVRADVMLTCTYNVTKAIETYFWIKLLGDVPVVLGRATSFNYADEKVVSRITTKQESGRFFLKIANTELSDTGFYYCLKSHKYSITFIKGTFLKITGPGPRVTAIIQDPADPVQVGDPVTLQCSVLFDNGKPTCLEDPSIYWFRVGLDESTSNLLYAQADGRDQCERRRDAPSPHRCVYSFSKNVTWSDAGTYHCAVATCGELLFGNGTKLDVNAVGDSDSHRDNTDLFLLYAALATSLMVVTILVCVLVKMSYCCCNVAATRCDQRRGERNEDGLVYSTGILSTTGGKAGRRKVAETEETIYSDVRTFVTD